MNALEFFLAEDVDAAFLAPGENQSIGKFLTKLSGEDDPALFIKTRRVSTQKHWPTAPQSRCPHIPNTATTLLCTPLYSTTHHSQRNRWRFSTTLRIVRPEVTRILGQWKKVEGPMQKAVQAALRSRNSCPGTGDARPCSGRGVKSGEKGGKWSGRSPPPEDESLNAKRPAVRVFRYPPLWKIRGVFDSGVAAGDG